MLKSPLRHPSMHRLLLCVLLPLTSFAQAAPSVLAAPAPVPSSPRSAPEEPAASQDAARQAPEAAVGNKPPEAELSPPPDAEKVQTPPGFVQIHNPAFPVSMPEAVQVDRGRRFDEADLTPYFRDGKRAEARAAYDAGRFTQALELLKGQGEDLPARYLRALLQLKAGQAAPAAEAMEALSTQYLPMKDRCLAHAALANEELGRWKEAAALYAQIAATSRLYPDARFGLSRARRHLGDPAGAAEALEPILNVSGAIWGRDYSAEALLAQADLARERRDTKAERAALLRLWSTHPLSNMSKQAEKRLRGVKPPIEAQVARAEALIEVHRNKQGLKILQPLLPQLKLPDELACRARFVYGKGLRKEREHTRAQAVLMPVASQCKSQDLKARALYVLGSSQSIVDTKQGALTYEALARDFPAHPFADDALFFAADLYVKNGDPATALKRLETLEHLYPGGDFFAEALFKSFWIFRTAKDKARALGVLDRIEQELSSAEETYDVERARYWRARIYESDGRGAEAAQLYERLGLEHPATYYGLMARGRLRALDGARADKVVAAITRVPPVASPWPLYAGALGSDPHFTAGVELLRMGFGDAASNEFLGANRAGQAAESLRLLVQLLAASGDTRSAHAIARVSLRRDLSGVVRPETRRLWELAYPSSFRDLVERSCKKAKLDPDLLQALMREESALDPKALSWAGALGLTQLMLPTAKSVARDLKVKATVTPESLLEPELNIELGAAYLGKLVARFEGNAHYALASYNAGAGAVEHWRADKPALELDEWVEEIPIAETRGYVKRVLRSYNTYQLLYGRLAAPAAPSLPVSRSAQL